MTPEEFALLLQSFEEQLPLTELPVGAGQRGAWIQQVATIELVAVATGYEDVPFCKSLLSRVDTHTRDRMLLWGPWAARGWMSSNRDLLPPRVRTALEEAGHPYQLEWTDQWQRRWEATVRSLDDEAFTVWGPGQVLTPSRLIRLQVLFLTAALLSDAGAESLVPLFLAGQNQSLAQRLRGNELPRQSPPDHSDAPVLAVRNLGVDGVELMLDIVSDFLNTQRAVTIDG